jgi:hypothetical protein
MAHNIKNPLTQDYREMIPDMCSNCHANKDIVSKYGLSTDVVKTYLSDFHGITLGFYKKQREELTNPQGWCHMHRLSRHHNFAQKLAPA